MSADPTGGRHAVLPLRLPGRRFARKGRVMVTDPRNSPEVDLLALLDDDLQCEHRQHQPTISNIGGPSAVPGQDALRAAQDAVAEAIRGVADRIAAIGERYDREEAAEAVPGQEQP